MSAATKEWTIEFTCNDCKHKVITGVDGIALGAFEFDDATFSHTSRAPYAHCSNCGAPYKLSADQVPALVLRQIAQVAR